MVRLVKSLERWSKRIFVVAALVVLALIGSVDYLTGFQVFFSVFYLLDLALATWYVGRGFGLVMSVLSVVVWLGGDLAAGARFSNPLVPIWNALILLTFYMIVVALLTRLKSLQLELSSRVEERTRALTREIAERQRLEEEILKVSEREQRRIGHELHDSLCQHLTATALAGQVLSGRLEAKAMREAKDALQVVDLVEQGITMARNLARGLYPVEMEAEGLMAAFQELAQNTSSSGRTLCLFECHSPVLIHDDAAATHLYRIAQEAVLNAIRHGKAKRVGISLIEDNGLVKLAVEDDGMGMPESLPTPSGLGIRIMAYRSAMIGGDFSCDHAPTGGTIVTCSFPTRPADQQRSKP